MLKKGNGDVSTNRKSSKWTNNVWTLNWRPCYPICYFYARELAPIVFPIMGFCLNLLEELFYFLSYIKIDKKFAKFQKSYVNISRNSPTILTRVT